MFKQIITLLALFSIAHLNAQSAPDVATQDAMVQDLEAVKYTMSIKYAPKEWKKDHLGWDLDFACDEAKAKIFEEGHSTSKDYQKIFKSFLKSPHDYHVNTLFYSTEWSVFPITAKSVDGHYYISSFDIEISLSFADLLFMDEMDEIENPERVNLAFSRLNIGDEIVALNGVPIKDVIEKIVTEQFGGDHSDTGYALAEKSLFYRRGQYGEEVPSGTFDITVLPNNAVRPITYQLHWLHFPEWIMNKSLTSKETNPNTPFLSSLIKQYLNRDFTAHYAVDLLGNKAKRIKQNFLNTNANTEEDGEDCEENEDWREKGFLPELGEVIWETSQENDFYAYLYKNEKGQKIGYLYLSSFNYDDDAEQMLNQIIEILKYFDKESEALVLDINDNPGGNLMYTYGVLSVLTDKPMAVPSDREILTQEDVYMAAVLFKFIELLESYDREEGDTLWGYPCDKDVNQGIINYCHKIIDTWESGKTMTDPIYVFGIENIKPNPEIQYTKPILLLINELDFSCADFFPAILQDNNRATLFGNTTAGAGGYVRSYQHSSRFGVMGYTLTGSIAFRKDGQPIENLGVTPDVPYKCSKRDIVENYADYIDAVNNEVVNILNKE